ncbi:MAG: hypothetical protein WAT93_10110, partial [Pontixanthobacter sp.]
IAVLSSFASIKVGTPDREAAVASALKGALGEYIPDDQMMDKNPALGFVVMCVESKQPFDVKRMAAHLSDTIVRPIPVSDCTSKTVEGDFGMFAALTTFYDKSGDEAGHFEIAKVVCDNSSECVVDIDWHGAGQRYFMRRTGPVWKVVSQRNRWVV